MNQVLMMQTTETTDFSLARHQMVRDQLQRRGIHDRRVLEAMRIVPREAFVLPGMQSLAYADRAISIDCGQTISQPYIVALMTQELGLVGHELVLEVGTGSGYQTAILSRLASQVVSVERHSRLVQKAREALSGIGCKNVKLVVGDGSAGWPAEAPYDRILVAAAAQVCPPPLLDQLAEGGRLVIPLGDNQSQDLRIFARHGAQLIERDLVPCRFVPLIVSETGAFEAGASETE